MPSSLTSAPAGRGDRATPSRRGDPTALVLSLVPAAPAVGMLRRSASVSASVLAQPRRPPMARVPARSRLVFKSGVVRAG
jgi:hypothetical protein